MDKRVYNRCLSDDLQAVFDYQNSLMEKILKINPDAHCTYFPVEDAYQVSEWGKPISRMHKTKIDALTDAFNILSR